MVGDGVRVGVADGRTVLDGVGVGPGVLDCFGVGVEVAVASLVAVLSTELFILPTAVPSMGNGVGSPDVQPTKTPPLNNNSQKIAQDNFISLIPLTVHCLPFTVFLQTNALLW
jgi:hypothetical protein